MAADSDAVHLFRTLLQFRTVSAEGPMTGAYRDCCSWLETQCRDLGLRTQVVEPVAGKPVLVATLLGTEPSLPTVVLNSHYDVVPAMLEHWHIDPWAAVELEGRIYGRGAQDMKCVVAQYILALRRILAKSSGAPFRRTLHLTFVPDEEIGGKDGMGAFLKTDAFRDLGAVGVALDEGLASPTAATTVFYGERAPMWIVVRATGPTGHGSRFIADTAVAKLITLANKALAFRAQQVRPITRQPLCPGADQAAGRLDQRGRVAGRMPRG
jgi:aminoacylase